MKSQTVFWLNLLQMHEIQEPFHHHVTDLLFLKSSAWEKGFMGWTLFVYCPQFRQHSNYTKKQIFIVPQMIWSTAKCSWMYVCLGNLNKEEKFGISIEDFHFNIFFFLETTKPQKSVENVRRVRLFARIQPCGDKLKLPQ